MLELFLTFFKIGLFTFGGGYAMLSLISDACVEKKKWITADDMMNITVIAETTPGPIAINCATFVGYRQKGVRGSVAATLGVILPSFIIIFAISMFLNGFLEYKPVDYAFRGIKIGVGFLILEASFKMIKSVGKTWLHRGILVACAAVMLASDLFAWNFSSVLLMLVCAILSLSVFLVKGGEKK